MFEKVSSKIETLTPQKAAKMLTLNTFDAQRAVRPRWVGELANIIRNDMFLTGVIGIALFRNGGEEPKKYLVNGQHTSNAVILANKPVDAVIEEYNCETMDDVSTLYAQFDNNKPRTLGDVVKMELQAIGIGWSSRVASLLVSGATLKENLLHSNKQEKKGLLKKYLKQGEFLNTLLTNTPDKKPSKETAHLRRSPVVHAILLTWDKCQRDAELFWIEVRDGEGLTKKMPTYQLREFLKSSTFNRGQGAAPKNFNPVSSHEMTYRCITAWNAYRKGISSSLKYYPTKPIQKLA